MVTEATIDQFGNFLDYHFRIGKRCTEQGNYIIFEKKADDFSQVVFRQRADEGTVRLRVLSDKEYYFFTLPLEIRNFSWQVSVLQER